jgi:hypothetical protein
MPNLPQHGNGRVSVAPSIEIFVQQRRDQQKDKGIPKSQNHGGRNPTRLQRLAWSSPSRFAGPWKDAKAFGPEIGDREQVY